METITLENNISVFYITVTSFPDGILEAHNKLHALVAFSTGRKYFGISRPENGAIVYRAAAEEIHKGEGEKFHCNTLLLRKGEYTCLTVNDYLKDIKAIDKAFKELLSQPGLDPQGYCIEWYVNEKDVKCTIRLED